MNMVHASIYPKKISHPFRPIRNDEKNSSHSSSRTCLTNTISCFIIVEAKGTKLNFSQVGFQQDDHCVTVAKRLLLHKHVDTFNH